MWIAYKERQKRIQSYKDSIHNDVCLIVMTLNIFSLKTSALCIVSLVVAYNLNRAQPIFITVLSCCSLYIRFSIYRP